MVRDIAMTAAILGFFSSAWFGWAQDRPPKSWKALLAAGSAAGLVLAVTGGLVAWRNWDTGSVLSDDAAMRTYLIIVGIEFGAAAVGVGVLFARRRVEYVPPWICFVVGVHFFPMAPVLENAMLNILGFLLTAVALTAVPLARRRDLAVSATTGAGAGTVLVLFAAGTALTLLG